MAGTGKKKKRESYKKKDWADLLTRFKDDIESDACKIEAVINGDIMHNQDNKDEFHFFRINQEKNTNCGVYVYVLDKTIDAEKIDNYNDVSYSAKLKKKRAESEILYVGKSYDLRQRLTEHDGNEDKRPYSLKLKTPKRRDIKAHVRVFFLKEEFMGHKDIIIPLTERLLHKKLKPLAGSART